MYGITSSNSKNVTVRVIEVSNDSGTGAPVARIPVKDDGSGKLRIVSFKVKDYVVAELDRLAEQLKTSRSELLRLGVAVILAVFSDGGEARRLLEQLRELEERVNALEEDVEWLKGEVHSRLGPW